MDYQKSPDEVTETIHCAEEKIDYVLFFSINFFFPLTKILP